MYWWDSSGNRIHFPRNTTTAKEVSSMGSSGGPNVPASPDALCYSPFTLSPVTAHTQVSVSRVRGIAFVAAAVSCKPKEERVLWNTAGPEQSSLLVFLEHKVSCLVLAKAMERECSSPSATVVNRIHSLFIHSLIHSASPGHPPRSSLLSTGDAEVKGATQVLKELVTKWDREWAGGYTWMPCFQIFRLW